MVKISPIEGDRLEYVTNFLIALEMKINLLDSYIDALKEFKTIEKDMDINFINKYTDIPTFNIDEEIKRYKLCINEAYGDGVAEVGAQIASNLSEDVLKSIEDKESLKDIYSIEIKRLLKSGKQDFQYFSTKESIAEMVDFAYHIEW